MKNFFVILMITVSILGIWFGNVMILNHIFHIINYSFAAYVFLTIVSIIEIIVLFFFYDVVTNGIKYILFSIKKREVRLITFFPFVCIKKDDGWAIGTNMHFSFNPLISSAEYQTLKRDKLMLNIFIVKFVFCIFGYWLVYSMNMFFILVLVGIVGLKISLKINYYFFKEYDQRLILENLGCSEYNKIIKLITKQINRNIKNHTLIGENLWVISYFDLLNNRCLLSSNDNLYTEILRYYRECKNGIILQALLEILFNEIFICNRVGDIKTCDEIRLKLIEIDQEQDYMYVGFVKSNYQKILKRNYSDIYIRSMYNFFLFKK